MDDVIQVIIFLFVIWSFLSSAFKKKPEPQKPKKQSGQNSQNRTKQTMNYSTKDILEDLLGVPLPKTGNEFPNKSEARHYPQDFEHGWDTEKEDVSLEKTKSNVGKEIPDIDFDKLNSLENEGKLKRVKPNEPLLVKSVLFNERASEIKGKVKNSSTLRDAIILSEILNKPKALR